MTRTESQTPRPGTDRPTWQMWIYLLLVFAIAAAFLESRFVLGVLLVAGAVLLTCILAIPFRVIARLRYAADLNDASFDPDDASVPEEVRDHLAAVLP